MKIDRVVVGSYETNCYILEKDNKLLLIDPGEEYDKIKKVINGRKVIGILITHRHFDHIGALDKFKNIPLYEYANLSEKKYNIEPFNFRVIFNPGHTSDSISFYFEEEKSLFCGDFIFYHSIGRCDLPTGDINAMEKSIEKIKKLPTYVSIYPGHGIKTTLEEEFKNNYYFY